MARRRRNRNRMGGQLHVLSNRELIADVLTDGTGVHSFQLGCNPASFVWLANASKCYGRYRFRELRLEYEPYVGTQTDGRVMAAWIPDPADANKWDAYTTSGKLTIMTQIQKMVSTQVHRRVVLNIPGSTEWKFVDQPHVEVDAEERQEDYGHFLFLTVAGPVSKTVGSWYLYYRVEFADPQAPALAS